MTSKKLTQKSAKKIATDLHSRYIRSLHEGPPDGPCLASRLGVIDTPCSASGGHTQRIQCAHIISRKYSATRTMSENAWPLCAGHHVQVDNNPYFWAMLVNETCKLEQVRQLMEQARSPLTIPGEADPVSALMFWRYEAEHWVKAALAHELSMTGIPKWFIKQVEENEDD